MHFLRVETNLTKGGEGTDGSREIPCQRKAGGGPHVDRDNGFKPGGVRALSLPLPLCVCACVSVYFFVAVLLVLILLNDKSNLIVLSAVRGKAQRFVTVSFPPYSCQMQIFKVGLQIQ